LSSTGGNKKLKIIDLSGEWRYETDADNIGYSQEFYKRELKNDGFKLPGSACENAVGIKQESFLELSLETVRCLRQKYNYIGALWLQRDVYVPESFDGKHLTLFLERVNIASELWIDGEKVHRQIIELSTPHEYDLTGILTSGNHTLTLRIDNSDLLNIDGMASGYSDDTQSIWLGIIGKIELRCKDIFHISNLQIFPNKNSVDVKLTACSDCKSPHERRSVSITLQATAPNGQKSDKITYQKILYTKKQILHLEYPMGDDIQYWSEFNPVLYTMTATLTYSGEDKSEELEDICVSEQKKSIITSGYDEKSVTFGMRTIEVKDKEFILNGKPIALRGTLDCAIYPMTGYPPTDLETWMHTMKTVKKYGLNHVRFHAWCPPEAAFAAADMVGIYVLAEMPFWLNTDVCALAAGDDPIHKYYYAHEMVNISNAFGNHPSFIMFSNGNELLGDFEMLENLTTQIKAVDNRRLYTMTSNFDHAVAPCEDYLCAFEANGHRIRIQVFHDVVSEHTRLTYDYAVEATDVPIVSFEVGQYCVYPNVDSVLDYSGNMLPVNFEIIGKEMKRHGIYHKLNDYIYASGKLAVLLYKEDIEVSLRTHKMGGFQLLGISDYTGQGTATVGLLDVFWNSKGLIESEEFREFCSPVVPLMKADRIFNNDEIFTADFDLYDYGSEHIENIVYDFKLYDGENVVYQIETEETSVLFALDFVKKPSKLTAVLSVGDYKNRWNIFVYPKSEAENKIKLINGYTDELEEIIKNGGKAIVKAANLAKPIEGLFKPVFWSPAWFESQRACGLICSGKHPIFNHFPTDDYADFQWKHPIDNSVSADISSLPKDFELILEPVPNFFDNTPRSPLFEAKVGNADILFCGFDLDIDKKAVKALKNSIFKYVNSDKFAPKQSLDKETFRNLFK
jgi:hypothetical protein